jgi:DNA-binding NtrC family response regulator
MKAEIIIPGEESIQVDAKLFGPTETAGIVETESVLTKPVLNPIMVEYDKLAKEVTEAIKPLKAIEQAYILQVLEVFDGNKTATAKALGITIKTLYNKLHRYGFTFTKGEKNV